jgi:hypothetical protein
MARVIVTVFAWIGFLAVLVSFGVLVMISIGSQVHRHRVRRLAHVETPQSVVEDGFDQALAELLRHAASCGQCKRGLAAADPDHFCAVGALLAESFAQWFATLTVERQEVSA